MPLLSEHTANLKGAGIAGSFLRGLAAGGAGGGGSVIPTSLSPYANSTPATSLTSLVYDEGKSYLYGLNNAGNYISFNDFTDPENPSEIVRGTFNDPQSVFQVSPNQLVIVGGAGIGVIDLTSLPVYDYTQVNATIWGPASYDPDTKHLFVSRSNDSVYIFDMTDPLNPVLGTTAAADVSNLDDRNVDYNPETKQMWLIHESIVGIDFTDPENPVVLENQGLGSGVDSWCCAVSGEYLIARVGDNAQPESIWVYDISDPQNPSVVDIFTLPDNDAPLTLNVVNGVLYTGDWSEDIYWYDLANLPNLVQTGDLRIGTDTWGITGTEEGTLLFVSTSSYTKALQILTE